LGLSVSKRLAQCLGGDLTLSEERKEGCEFVLELRLKIVESCKKQFDYPIGVVSKAEKLRFKLKFKRVFKRPKVEQINELPEEQWSSADIPLPRVSQPYGI
jgi:hypothetical protein